MAKPEGIFELRNPRQLLEKLEADFERWQAASPISKEAQYAAFNFFVTAEHLPEWLAKATGANVRTLRDYADGKLVSHVANGAKHFRVNPKLHNAMRETRTHSGAFQASAFQNDAFDVDRLIIEHENGRLEAALDVATRVLDYWKTQLT